MIQNNRPQFPQMEVLRSQRNKGLQRWRNSFQNFVDDMGQRPKELTIDRFPNKNGDYEQKLPLGYMERTSPKIVIP